MVFRHCDTVLVVLVVLVFVFCINFLFCFIIERARVCVVIHCRLNRLLSHLMDGWMKQDMEVGVEMTMRRGSMETGDDDVRKI